MSPRLVDIACGGYSLTILVRSVGAFVVAFFTIFLLGRRAAAWLYRRGYRDRVRDYDEFFGQSKSGTPTMGGILLVAALAIAAVSFCDLGHRCA